MEKIRPQQQNARRIIGIDLSKRTYVACILSGENLTRKEFFNGQMGPKGRPYLLSRIMPGDQVIMEGGSSSFSLARYLSRNTEAQIHVLNPMKLHIIFESMCKTDRQDSAKLAEYARDTRPENWVTISVPSEDESAERELINMYVNFREDRTKSINRLHAVFNSQGFPDLKKSDLDGKPKRERWISELLEECSEARTLAEMISRQIDFTDELVEDCVSRIRSNLERHGDLALQWLSIPGIGMLTAASIIAFTGDLSRFTTADQLRNYVGLIPKRDQSGNVDKRLGVSKHGCKAIRRHIVQGGWYIIQNSPDCSLSDYCNELRSRGKKGQKAAVAIANKMLTIGFALVRTGQIYDSGESLKILERKLKREKISLTI